MDIVNSTHREINILPNSKDLFQSAAEDFTQRAVAAVDAKGSFTVVLSGGSTPAFFFDALTENEFFKEQIPWGQILFFFGDERYVPADNVESNYHMANEHLFSKVPILAKNIYPILTSFSDPQEAAEDYEFTLRTVFHVKKNEFPTFDIVYLGLGEDAHTASLMPLSNVVMTFSKNKMLEKNYQLVASLWVPTLKMNRITLTPSAINHSECVCFLVTGSNKATAVWKTIEGPFEPQHTPAQLIHCIHGKTIWYLDQAAATKLGKYKSSR
jgi:6-phosphogluconolactonase